MTTENWFAVYWPNDAKTSLDTQLLSIPATNAAWKYYYGSIAITPETPWIPLKVVGNIRPMRLDNPTYNFIWDSQDPKKIVTQSNLPPISSSRWNPDIGKSTNTAAVLTMAFYQTMDATDSASMLANGSNIKTGAVFWPNSAEDIYWYKEMDVAWPADTSTANNNTNNDTSNTDSAMMLAQGLAAGATLLAALSF